MSTHHRATDVHGGLVTEVTIAGGVEQGDTFELADFQARILTVQEVQPGRHPHQQATTVRHSNGHTMAVTIWTS